MRRWRAGTAAGGVIVADATIRSPLSFVRQSATSGTMPAPGDGAGLHHLLRGRPTEAGAAPISRALRVEAVDWNGSGEGAWGGVPAARPVTDLAALRQAEAEVEAKGPDIERGRSRERLQVDGLKRRRAKRSEMLMHLLSSASGLRHRCKESRRFKRNSALPKQMTMPNASSCTRVLKPSFISYRFSLYVTKLRVRVWQ